MFFSHVLLFSFLFCVYVERQTAEPAALILYKHFHPASSHLHLPTHSERLHQEEGIVLFTIQNQHKMFIVLAILCNI